MHLRLSPLLLGFVRVSDETIKVRVTRPRHDDGGKAARVTERQCVFEGAESDVGDRGVVEEAVGEVRRFGLCFQGVLQKRLTGCRSSR